MTQPNVTITGRAGARPRVAFQGERGAYSEGAIDVYWRGDAEPVPCRSCQDVARAVSSGTVDAGLLALENTLAGAVPESYDALVATRDLTIVGEVIVPVHHAVLALPGATLATLQTIESHPVALAQCRRFLAAHPGIAPRAVEDTAGAAADVAAARDPRRAAIASGAVAERLGLAVLAAGIEDRADNQTRFVAVATRGTPPISLAPGAAACTTLLVEPAGGASALGALLAAVDAAGLRLRGLTIRPTGEPWRSRYVLDIAHAAEDRRLAPLLAALTARAHNVRVIGTYGSATPDGRPGLPDDGGAAGDALEEMEYV